VVADRLPPPLADSLPEMRESLSTLARLRGPAFYGYEQEGVTASESFGGEAAMKILEVVRRLVTLCVSFVRAGG